MIRNPFLQALLCVESTVNLDFYAAVSSYCVFSKSFTNDTYHLRTQRSRGNPFALVRATDVAFVSRETFRDYFISCSKVASRTQEHFSNYYIILHYISIHANEDSRDENQILVINLSFRLTMDTRHFQSR